MRLFQLLYASAMEMIKKIMFNLFVDQFGIENNYSVNVVLQEIPVGGNHAMYTTGFSTENCCHSWRKESKMCLVMDVFYDPNDNKAQVSQKQ